MTADAAVRGTVMLARAFPGSEPAQVLRLELGDRESALLELRCATFGEMLSALTACPLCGVQLAVEIPHERLRRSGARDHGETVELEVSGVSLTARMPDGYTLAQAAALPDVASVRDVLVRRCIVDARGPEGSIDPLDLPPAVVARAGEALVDCDPSCEVWVELNCAGCGHESEALFDAGSFLWEELAAMSVRLIDEVDVLARAYHWNEAEILRLSSRRRRRYLERVIADG